VNPTQKQFWIHSFESSACKSIKLPDSFLYHRKFIVFNWGKLLDQLEQPKLDVN